jgi:Mg2+ and Co2+ transporter CorA
VAAERAAGHAGAWPSLRADDANTLWVDVDAPTDEETARVAEMFMTARSDRA